MFGIFGKSSPDVDYTFSDGGRYVVEKGERRYYPVNLDPNTTKSYMSDDSLIWTDPHHESSLVSMQVPYSYRTNFLHLFPGPASFKMLFNDTQKTNVAEFFGQLEDKIRQEKAAKAAQKAAANLLAARKAVRDTNISVLVDGKEAAVSIQDGGIGAVLCPVCDHALRTPDGAFKHVEDVFTDISHIKAYKGETLTHCKHCNELYKVEIDIRGE